MNNSKPSKTTDEAAEWITREGDHWDNPDPEHPKWISYAFRTSSEVATFEPFSPEQKTAAREAMQSWEDVADVVFDDDQDSNSANILFGNVTETKGVRGAYAATSEDGNILKHVDIYVDRADNSTISLPLDSFEYLTLVHEIGHSIGLDHPGGYNASDGRKINYSDNAVYKQDTRQYSVMSYFSEGELEGTDGERADFGGVFPRTPMMHDIAAAQRLYGANMSTRTGDTTYGFHSNAGPSYNISEIKNSAVFCIWDAGGRDSLDFTKYTADSSIYLSEESFSDVGSLKKTFLSQKMLQSRMHSLVAEMTV